MNDFNFSMYDVEETPKIEPISSNKINTPTNQDDEDSSFNFSMYDEQDSGIKKDKEEDEGWLKWAARTALQIPKGIAQAQTFAADLIQSVGYEESTDPFEIERLRKISEDRGIPFDEEKYMQAAQNAANYFPTVNNLSREIEGRTGLPLEAKDRFQKFVNFASSAGKIAPKESTLRPFNTALPKPILGAGVAGVAEAGKTLGVPEPIADIASFLALKQPTSGASISIGKKTKPSGLPERNYEKLKETKEVSEKKIGQINEKVERDVRKIADKIIEDTPLHETRESLKDVSFKKDSREAFKEVQKIADSIPGEFSTDLVKKELVDRVMNKKGTGYAASEYDKNFRKQIVEILKSTPKQNIKAGDLVTQYRKNNAEIGQIYEPGQSFAYNKAKRDALLEHNRAIASIIENRYPNSEFSDLFKKTNQRWTSIMDAEAIDGFLDSLFKGKINFDKGRNFFQKEGMDVPFKRALGKEGFGKFETLMIDLMSTEQASKHLKKAKRMGFDELAKTAGAFIVHPNLGKAKLAFKALKGGYNTIYEMVLDKPQIAITWDKGINALKKGDFKAAERQFDKVKQAEREFQEAKAVKPDEIKSPPSKPSAKTESKKGDTINVRPLNQKTEPIKDAPKDTVKPNVASEVQDKISALQKTGKYVSPQQVKLEHKPKIESKSNSQKHLEYDKPTSNIKEVGHTPAYKEKVESGPLKGSTIEIRMQGEQYPGIYVNGEKPILKRIGPGFDYDFLDDLKELYDLHNYEKKYGKKTPEATRKASEIIEKAKKSLEKKKIDKEKRIKEPARKERIERTVNTLGETRGKGQQYHGTSQKFQEINPDHFSESNIYGQGFYTTDAIDIAQGYTRGKGNDYSAKSPQIFKVDEKRAVKLYDLEKDLNKDLKAKLNDLKYESLESAMSENPKSLRDVYDSIHNEATLQDAQEVFYAIQDIIESLGYEGLTHIGGEFTGHKPHKVNIYFNPLDSLKITPLKSSRQIPKNNQSKSIEMGMKKNR